MASGGGRRRRSIDEPLDLCDLRSRHVEQARSFNRWFDLSEPRMRQMEREFQKIVSQVKEIQRTTDTFRKGGAVSGILGLVICVVGVMAAPFTDGVSLPAAAAFGVAVAAFGRAVDVGAKVKKTIKERCRAKEAEKLGKEFMEIVKPIQNGLEEIQLLCKKLEEKPRDVRSEGALSETEEFEKILSELRSKRGDMSDVVFAVMKEINVTLRLVTNFFRVTATPEEDDKFSDAIVKSAHQYQKVLGEFDSMKKELEDFTGNK